MAAGSTAFYSQQYASAVELVAQQMRPRIASLCTPMMGEGKAATVVNMVDAGEADERTGVYEPIVFGEPTHTRPWVYPRHFDKALPFDSIEQMQMNANPTSSYVMGVLAALNRRSDDEVIRAFFAARNLETNDGGIASTTFAAAADGGAGSTMAIGVSVGGTTSGLNVEKIQAALEVFRGLEVGVEEEEQINCVISAKQERNLMNELEVTSSDFTVKRIMDAGTMVGSGYMKINWVLSSRLLADSNNYRRVPFFTSRGMSFTTWGAVKSEVSQRKDLRGHPWQVYGENHVGSVRRDAKRVIEIKCSEA